MSSESSHEQPEVPEQVVLVGPDGNPVVVPPAEADEPPLTDLVEQPAKVMRIGRMVQALLEEVKSAPLDEPGRTRLAEVVHTSIAELKDGLAPELDAELDRLIKPFDQSTPSESELRVAQAQLVGWLEGLFHGIQTAIYAQQMAARNQLEQMRALPPGALGMGPDQVGHPAHPGPGHSGAQSGTGGEPGSGEPGGNDPNGMYL